MKKLLSLALALMMLLAMTACSETGPDISGTYWATSCYIDGEAYSFDGEYLELEDDGTGVVKFIDDLLDIDWKLKGDVLTFTDEEGDKFEGTYDSDGVIEGNYAGIDYVYELNASGSKGNKASAVADVAVTAEEPEEAPEEEPVEEAAIEPKESLSVGNVEAMEADLGDYHIAVVGAEAFEDMDGAPAFRVYYDFTNNSEELAYGGQLDILATQSGFELVEAYARSEDDVPEYGNDWLYVYPGVTIRCIQEMSYQPGAGTITMTFEDWWSEESVSVEIDPENFSGRPAADWEIEAISEPDYTAAMSDAGDIGGSYFFIDEAELTEDWYGNDAIRVFVEYTNGNDEDYSCWLDSSFYAFQDGIELATTWVEVETDEDLMYKTEIAPGETAVCAIVWELRGTSPVEVVYDGIWEDVSIGCRYNFE